MLAGTVTAKLVLNTDEFTSGLKTAIEETRVFIKELESSGVVKFNTSLSEVMESAEKLTTSLNSVNTAVTNLGNSGKDNKNLLDVINEESKAVKKLGEEANKTSEKIKKISSSQININGFNKISSDFLRLSESGEKYIDLLKRMEQRETELASVSDEAVNKQINALENLSVVKERLEAKSNSLGSLNTYKTELEMINKLISSYERLNTEKLTQANVNYNLELLSEQELMLNQLIIRYTELTDAETRAANTELASLTSVEETINFLQTRVKELGLEYTVTADDVKLFNEAVISGSVKNVESTDKFITSLEESARATREVGEEATNTAEKISRITSAEMNIGGFNKLNTEFLSLTESGEKYLTLLKKMEESEAQLSSMTKEAQLEQANAIQDLTLAKERLVEINNSLKDTSIHESEITMIDRLINSYERLNTAKLEQANVNYNLEMLNEQELKLNQLIMKYAELTNEETIAANAELAALTTVNETTQFLEERVAQLGLQYTITAEDVRLFNEAVVSGSVKNIESTDKFITSLEKVKSTSAGVATSTASEMNKIASSTASASNGVRSLGNAMSSSTSSISGFGTALTRVSSIVKLFGTLYVWDLVMNLGSAVKSTVAEKSEMESLFQTMNWGQSNIDYFNNALDTTVQTFQKMNKYNLGETLASLGQEFGLSAKELEKAAPVLAMVQSEYIRAGRNESEATLAVKDVLQGEFVRLSRETGVGKSELMAAGWSGDTKDVESLLTALEQVGTSRHWDMFATKATSLNDVLMILQNRFAEFSTDLISQVTPVVLLAFNGMIEGIDFLSKAFGKINDMTGGVLGNGLLAGALGAGVTALAMYRTEANLAELAQMGFTKSIAATILGLNAESVNTLGVVKTIAAKVLGIEEEAVAQGSLSAAIAEKNIVEEISNSLGTESAMVEELKKINIDETTASTLASVSSDIEKMASEEGVTLATLEFEAATKLSKAGMDEATASTYASIIAENQYKAANLSTTQALLSRLLGLNELTVAEYNLGTAIWANITGVNASTIANNNLLQVLGAKLLSIFGLTTAQETETAITIGAAAAHANFTVTEELLTAAKEADVVATTSLTAATLTLTGVIIPLGIAIGVVVGVLYSYIQSTVEAAQTMSNFNDLVNNGDQIIQTAQETADGYANQVSELKTKLASTAEGTTEYNETLKELEETTKLNEQAQKNLASAIDSVKKAQSAKGSYESTTERSNIKTQAEATEIMEKYGVSTENAKLATDDYYNTVVNGNKYYASAAQYTQRLNQRTLNDLDTWGKKLNTADYSRYSKDILSATGEMEAADAKSKLSDDPWDRAFGSLEWHWANMKRNLVDIRALWDSSIGEPLGDFLNGTWDNLTSNIGDMSAEFNSKITQPITDWWNSLWDGSAWDWLSSGMGGSLNLNDILMMIPGIGPLLSGAVSLGDVLGDVWSQVFGDWNPLESLGEWWDSLWSNSDGSTTKMIDGAWLLEKLFGALDSTGITEWFNTNISQPIMDWFANFDLWTYLGNVTMTVDKFLGWLFGLGDTPLSEAISTWFNEKILIPITEWFANFDLYSYLGNLVMSADRFIGWLFGLGDTPISEAITNWFNNTVLIPIQEWFANFDLFLYLGNLVQNADRFIGYIFGFGDTPISEVISNWVNNTFIPGVAYIFSGQAIFDMIKNYVANDGENNFLDTIFGTSDDWSQAGQKLGEAFSSGLMGVLYSIPVIGPLLQLAAEIQDQEPSFETAGGEDGKGTTSGFENNLDLESAMNTELDYVWDALDGAKDWLSQKAAEVGGAISSAFAKLGLGAGSPGNLARATSAEMMYVNESMVNSQEMLAQTASNLGNNISTSYASNMNMQANTPNVNTNQVIDQPVLNPDANQEAINQYTTDNATLQGINNDTMMNTTTTFTGMNDTINTSFTTLGTNLTTTFDTMKTKTTTDYNSMVTTTQNSLNNMRTSTQNVTTQMTNAWWVMRDNIVSAASTLQSESTAHFDSLSGTIGTFYVKLQNPSMWGGPVTTNSTGIRTRSTRGGSSHRLRVAGPMTSSSGKNMKIKDILSMICPNGNCFNIGNLNTDETVNLASFLRMIAPDGGFGWYDWNSTHYNHIKDTTDLWSMVGPQIMGYISTGTTFKVGEFENGTPNISFDSFQKMAEALFSAVGYDGYYNSDKTGSWVTALQTGSVNCWDGTSALLALASTCGFSGHMEQGTWNGIPHVYAVINGKKMDTTGWQNRRSWAGVSAGPVNPKYYPNNNNSRDDRVVRNINVNVDLSNSNIYGVDDLDEQIESTTLRTLDEVMGDG